MPTVVDAIREKMAQLTETLEQELDADVLGLFGPIVGGVENQVRGAIESLPERRSKLAIVLDTGGGSIEVTERIVSVVRHHYGEVVFIVPDLALSAGTVLALSGDAIMMDYFSCLGPIDPQVEKDGKLIPALSYLEQYTRLVDRASQGALTTAELALLSKLDLAELHLYEQARELTIDLLEAWLARYKFKNWTETQTTKQPVTQEMREQRAREIASQLSKHTHWRSHGRGITMEKLRTDLNLVIDDFARSPSLTKAIRQYADFVKNCMLKENLAVLVASRTYL